MNMELNIKNTQLVEMDQIEDWEKATIMQVIHRYFVEFSHARILVHIRK